MKIKESTNLDVNKLKLEIATKTLEWQVNPGKDSNAIGRLKKQLAIIQTRAKLKT